MAPRRRIFLSRSAFFYIGGGWFYTVLAWYERGAIPAAVWALAMLCYCIYSTLKTDPEKED